MTTTKGYFSFMPHVLVGTAGDSSPCGWHRLLEPPPSGTSPVTSSGEKHIASYSLALKGFHLEVTHSFFIGQSKFLWLSKLSVFSKKSRSKILVKRLMITSVV